MTAEQLNLNAVIIAVICDHFSYCPCNHSVISVNMNIKSKLFFTQSKNYPASSQKLFGE